MSANNGPWFRCYCDIYRNPKLRMLPEIYQLRYIWILALFKENETLMKQNETLAFALRLTETEVDETLKALREARLLTKNNTPTGWNERQFESDTSTFRVRKHRVLQKRSRNVTETPSDTDTETDTDTESESLSTSYILGTVAVADQQPMSSPKAAPTPPPDGGQEDMNEKMLPMSKWLALARADAPPGVVGMFWSECERCLQDYYGARGGRLTPTRIGFIGKQFLRWEESAVGLAAIEVFCDRNGGSKDERYLVGIARRFGKMPDEEFDREMTQHRSRMAGRGLWDSREKAGPGSPSICPGQRTDSKGQRQDSEGTHS